jgi:hypothetical protein
MWYAIGLAAFNLIGLLIWARYENGEIKIAKIIDLPKSKTKKLQSCGQIRPMQTKRRAA